MEMLEAEVQSYDKVAELRAMVEKASLMATLSNKEKSWWVYFVRTPQNSPTAVLLQMLNVVFAQHCSGTGAKALEEDAFRVGLVT